MAACGVLMGVPSLDPDIGELVDAGRTVRMGRCVVAAMVLALPQTLPAQASVTSNLAHVALVAEVGLRASIPTVGPAVQTARQGQLREASVNVRFAANTGYRLVVLSGGAVNGSRVWVRAASGEYKELTPGASVTVARGTRSSGQWEREVSYRIESSAGEVFDLPVR
jgi:hypothetical protein